jgi:lipopolysaccharide export LptBFGC system permease protein LptF
MKNSYLILLCLVIVSACSEKKFAYRKKIRVDKNEQVAQTVKPKSPKLNKQEIASQHEPNALKNDSAIATPNVTAALAESRDEQLSAGPASPIEEKQEWKTETNKPKQEKQVEKKQKHQKTQSQNGFAIAGFILSLVGLFIFPLLFCTLGIIFSAIGLKSDYKGLAIAGVILGVVGLVLWLALVALVV